MGLAIGIILFLYILCTHAPASASLRRGKEMYWEMRRNNSAAHFQEARDTDRYYNPATGTINRHFYSDGSVQCDTSTGKCYAKGQYFCEADGTTADYKKADAAVIRPPK